MTPILSDCDKHNKTELFGFRATLNFPKVKYLSQVHSLEQREEASLHFALVDTVESRVLYGVCRVCRCLIAFLLSTEGRRKDPEELWSSSRVGRLKTDDEEGLASQQETQMIFFIQQVA